MSSTDDVLERLLGAGVDDDTADLVLAALTGPEVLAAALVGENVERPTQSAARAVEAPGAYLASIEATGFRGIGPTARLDLVPGPGLTVVVGRNGSGKSSFAEALEVLLTGDSYRWKGKPAEWKEGWRNLHQRAGSRVAARFAVEGSTGPTLLVREWDDAAKEAADADTVVQPHGRKHTHLAGYGWSEAVELHRPILSHPELGVMADNPSSLFDALSSILGLDDLAEAADLLKRTRTELEKPLKDAKRRLQDDLLPALTASDDPRAEAARGAVDRRTWDLDAAAATVISREEPTEATGPIEALARLEVPDAAAVETAVSELHRSRATLTELEGSESGRSRRTIDLLETALAEHSDHGDQPCPVCGTGSLDAAWRSRAEAQVAELRRLAAAYDAAVQEAVRCQRQARDLVRPLPAVLADPPAGFDVSRAVAAWERWAEIPNDSATLAAHLSASHGDLHTAVTTLARQAAGSRAAMEDAWRPLAVRLQGWVESARSALGDQNRASRLKAAEEALAAATVAIRTRRFQPISQAAIALWSQLRLQSNVDLIGVELSGRGTRRRVDLSVTVDGEEGAALGVVSQGEVNCLALSLFFPRVMLPESPFRFIVIDDPVQAMDPSRVDGLAHVLAQVAETRQLVVFTHDDRLPASLQRLGQAHTAVQVTRRPGSHVQVTTRIDPVNQYFADARAVDKDEKLPDAVASRVVPGFCRSGMEAACMEAVRRRRIGRGDPHLAVESELTNARRTTELVALALFDDAGQGSRVLGEINRRWGKGAGDAYRDANEGAHKGFSGSLGGLIDETQRLATALRSL